MSSEPSGAAVTWKATYRKDLRRHALNKRHPGQSWTWSIQAPLMGASSDSLWRRLGTPAMLRKLKATKLRKLAVILRLAPSCTTGGTLIDREDREDEMCVRWLSLSWGLFH